MRRNIIFFIPSIEGGGVEKNLILLLEYLSNRYKNVYLITANRINSKNLKNLKQIFPKKNSFKKKSRLFKSIICLYLLLNNFIFKKNLIISFQSNILSILVSKIFNFKIIIRLNTSLKKYINNNLKLYFFKFVYSLSDKIIVNSKVFYNELCQINLKPKLIYNLLDKNKIKNKKNIFKKKVDLKILNIGRLTLQKDQSTLIKSLKILKEKKINFHCCIIGRGKLKTKLQNLIYNLKLRKFITLIGFKSQAEKYLNECDIFVLTSKFEGLPNVLIEAQKYNVPIISSNCPTGPKEILLNGKLGDLFEPSDYKNLSQKLLSFHQNQKRLKDKSLNAKNYLNRFDLKKNLRKYENMILNLIK